MWANTTVQKTLNLQDVAKLPIPVATPDERLAIASVLGSLDDKIELNRRMNRTLEQMAAAIFKAWFVDFEPVRAKASGAASFPGMPQPVFDALPATFADSELGPIPEGWEVAGLGSLLVNIIDRVTPSQITEAMPYVPIDCIDAKSLTLSTSKPGTEAKSSLIRFRKDDILFGAMRPYFHKVCISPFDGTTRTTVFSLRPTATADLCFCALLLFQNSTIEFATQHSVGSTIPYAKWEESLAKMTCTIPPAAIRLGFDQIIRPMLLLARHNALESETLAETRDVLLPKLLSGEVRLPPTRGGGVIDDGSKSSTAQILAMARVADELESAPTPKWPELQCSGSHQAVMPVLDNGPAIERFEQQAYEHGFVIDFDWTGWQEQAGQYFSDPAHLAKADVHTVQRLVTTCIRKERFCEGTLASLHANGVLGAICRRLGQIAKESSK